MPLVVYNTLSGRKEAVEPLTPGRLGIYVCGPTVYDLSHVGHARVYVAFDTIVRYLRRNYAVTLVRNYTDVDDKIIKRAAEKGESPLALAAHYIAEYQRDMQTLGVAPGDVEPKVTEHMPGIIGLVQTLVARGFAYVAGGTEQGQDVYYAVEKFESYGRLAGRALGDMEAGARVEVNEEKRHPMDFALWKAAKPGEPAWDSPWGKGRPGWHIECSAMSSKYLGPSFDMHGGGKDLIFPHHENEIAQSEAASGKPFVRYWLHNGFVNVDNEKMSKSLGNFFTVREVLAKFDAQALRYFLLSTHYRSPINFSDGPLKEAEDRVKYLYETLARLDAAVTPGAEAPPHREAWVSEIVSRFEAAMDDDFNTPKALADLSEVFRLINEVLDKPKDRDTDARTLRAVRKALREVGAVLGLFGDEPDQVLTRIRARREQKQGLDAGKINALIAERAAARTRKDFKRADAIRQELLAMGVQIKDGPAGTPWEAV
ncbi:MAG: cysteine--tRNA ligase [Deltaproteobacteria bacterium]|nr:cysteine--tRNA ligase [Deltaproteobacteria bacterium]